MSQVIAVTGGSGRVGAGVISLALAQGHQVVSIDRAAPAGGARPANLTFIRADLTDYAALEAALNGCDALVHLAALASPRAQPDPIVHNNNVISSYNVLCAAGHLGIRRVCQASSINAIGGAFSRRARYDYFPVDEAHPTYNEDPYSLSKWICEQQAASLARRFDGLTIASLRLHGVVPSLAQTATWQHYPDGMLAKQLWGYTRLDAAARAFLAALEADFEGHEAFHIVAPQTMMERPSLELKAEHYPDVPLRGDLSGRQGFYDCSKATRLLGWQHDEM